ELFLGSKEVGGLGLNGSVTLKGDATGEISASFERDCGTEVSKGQDGCNCAQLECPDLKCKVGSCQNLAVRRTCWLTYRVGFDTEPGGMRRQSDSAQTVAKISYFNLVGMAVNPTIKYTSYGCAASADDVKAGKTNTAPDGTTVPYCGFMQKAC